MWKTGIALCMAGAFALSGCATIPSDPSREMTNSYQLTQRDRDRGGDRDRDGRYRRVRPNWWGQRVWYGPGVRPYWWGQRSYVLNSFILLGGYYYPFYFVNGYYYPDYTSPYVFMGGRYRRHFERPFIGSTSIRAGRARIINFRREQREDED